VPVAEPLEHLLVREEAGVVLAQQLRGELLVLDDNLSDVGCEVQVGGGGVRVGVFVCGRV
jgi:hypothetical protein